MELLRKEWGFYPELLKRRGLIKPKIEKEENKEIIISPVAKIVSLKKSKYDKIWIIKVECPFCMRYHYHYGGKKNKPDLNNKVSPCGYEYLIIRQKRIYFLYNHYTNLVKIGITNNLDKRIKTINSNSGVKVRLLVVIQGGCENEHRLHQKFKKYRKLGEWFEYSKEIKEYIYKINK